MQSKTKSALVTGATGFIGSHLAEELLSRAYQVRCTYRKTSNLQWLYEKNFELIETNLFDKDSIKRSLEGVDYIFHSAGLVSAWDYDGYLQGNLLPTENIIDSIIEEGMDIDRFVYVSSQTVTGPSSSYDKPMTEDALCKPISAYAKSKLKAEEYVFSKKEELPVTVIRPPGVFGPRDTAIFSLFKIISMHIAPYFGFSDKYVSLAYVKDLVKGMADSIEFENTKGEIYFIAYDEFFSYRDLFKYVKNALDNRYAIDLKLPEIGVKYAGYISELFGRLSKKPPVFNYDKGRDFVQNYWTCSVDKAKKDFRYKASTTIDEAIKETADWYIEKGWMK